jgi:mRNA interferase MazF
MSPNPCRGEVWYADLDPHRGHEQAGCRPVLIVSEDTFNHGPADLVVVVSLTATLRPGALRIPVTPPEGGLKVASVILCESLRSIAKERLLTRWGRVEETTLATVEDRLRILLGL